MINKKNLIDKLEPFIYEKLNKNEYEIIKKHPIKLLTWNRLDLAFKLFYLDNKDKLNDLAEKTYYQDIKSQTLGSFEEFGNDKKNNFERYIKEFDKTYESIKNNGFNNSKTLIPLSEVATIINGAHRIASAIHLDKEVACIDTKLPIMTCDYNYFYERQVPENILDIVMQTFIEYAEDTYIAFLWPSGTHSKEEALSKFSNIVYHKKVTLTPQGGLNLLIELYKHMDWVGDKNSGFKGAKQKLIECFPSFESLDVVVFQSDSIEKVRVIKEEVRQIYNIGFSSIHITDTKEEAIRISKLILNENGVHFLNYANPYKYNSTEEKNTKFKNIIQKNKLDTNDLLLDSGILLSLYGLREASDIDYFIDDNKKLEYHDEELEYHDEELEYHDEEKLELIYNPKYHFWYDGLKYISFSQLYKMKQNRNEEKDQNDCEMMESLIENNSYKQFISKMKQSYLYFKIKSSKNIMELVIKTLKVLRLYDVVRYIYRKARGRI